MQELQEALDQETTAQRQAQSTLEEAYRHRNNLEARCDVHKVCVLNLGSLGRPSVMCKLSMQTC